MVWNHGILCFSVQLGMSSSQLLLTPSFFRGRLHNQTMLKCQLSSNWTRQVQHNEELRQLRSQVRWLRSQGEIWRPVGPDPLGTETRTVRAEQSSWDLCWTQKETRSFSCIPLDLGNPLGILPCIKFLTALGGSMLVETNARLIWAAELPKVEVMS